MFFSLNTTPIKNIISITSQAELSVSNGTSFGGLLLPTAVLCTLDDTSTRSINVTWSSTGYDKDIAGIYILTGTTSLPSDVTNTNNIRPLLSVNVDVTLPPFNTNIDIGGATVETGWFRTGSVLPYPGSLRNVTYDLGNDIILRAINIDSIIRWNQRLTSGPTGIIGVPNSVSQALWNTDTNGTTPRIGRLTLENKSGGVNPLTGRIFTLYILCSRASITLTRSVRVTVNGVSKTIDSRNNTIELVFPNIQLIGGIITIDITSTTPTDSVNSYINYIRMISQ
jgi:hypothetical protein